MSGNNITTETGTSADLVVNSDGGKISFTAEPIYTGLINTDRTLINRSFYEDNFDIQQTLDTLVNTYENIVSCLGTFCFFL